MNERSRKRTLVTVTAPWTGGLARAGWLVGLLLAAGGGTLASGCSSDSDTPAFAEFEGTWRVESGVAPAPTSTFSLDCMTSQISVDLPLWDRLVIGPGTVSDLIEGPSNCQFAFNVTAANKKIASVPATDPYSPTATTVSCSTLINSSADPATGNTIDLFLDIVPSPWDFKLLAPVKGKAPTAQLVGTSAGQLSAFDVTAGTAAGSDSTCTYSVTANLTKLANN
jgi:hypothetical protein